MPPKPTPKKKEEPAAAPVDANVAALVALLQPLVDFHKASSEFNQDDLKLFWDVRLIRGNGEHYLSTTGTSTLSGALSGSSARLLTATLQDELTEKIARPLVSKAQDKLSEAVKSQIAESSDEFDTPLLGYEDEEQALQESINQAVEASADDED